MVVGQQRVGGRAGGQAGLLHAASCKGAGRQVGQGVEGDRELGAAGLAAGRACGLLQAGDDGVGSGGSEAPVLGAGPVGAGAAAAGAWWQAVDTSTSIELFSFIQQS